MRRDRRLRPPKQRHPQRRREPDALPSLIELERFDQASLHQWLAAKSHLDAVQRALYFELEPLRQSRGRALLDALRSATLASYQFEGWGRILDYRYGMEPLSPAGSLKGIGGRFNIGADLSPGSFTAFPALYIAEDYQTAFAERFGNAVDAKIGVLTALEIVLRAPSSFVHVRLRGLVENVIDVGNLESLRPVAGILREFTMPKVVLQTARKLGLPQAPWLIRSPLTLQRQLLHSNWRMVPQQFDLPSNSQIFGRLAVAAGLQAIVYTSTKGHGKRCLALFPQNWAGGGSFVEVTDTVPEGAKLTRLDGNTSSAI